MNLNEISGLPMEIDDAGKLVVDSTVVIDEYRPRMLEELKPVFLDPEACRGERIAYEMFNGVSLKEHQEILEGLPVRYELTLFPDMRVGKEYVKTLGHIHLPDAASGIDYPEICEVLAGRAHFLFMKLDPLEMKATEAFYVEIKAGQKLIIPPRYDHLTINPGPGPMLFSDVVARPVKGNYERISSAHGAVYLEVEEAGSPVFLPNPHYPSHPVLRQESPRDFPDLHLCTNKSLYATFVETRGAEWEFLWRPELFQKRFPDLKSLFGVH